MRQAATRDAAPVHRIARDRSALEAFYRAHFDRVLGFVARRCESPAEVADIVADVFVEAIRTADRFDPSRGEPAAWLLGIASNLIASSRRSRRRRQELARAVAGRELLAGDDYSRLEERIDAARLAPVLQGALDRLSSNERAVFELVAIEGLDTVEAARALGIGQASARMRLTRARRRFAREAGAASAELRAPTKLGEEPS